jgi:hypothetical protein
MKIQLLTENVLGEIDTFFNLVNDALMDGFDPKYILINKFDRTRWLWKRFHENYEQLTESIKFLNESKIKNCTDCGRDQWIGKDGKCVICSEQVIFCCGCNEVALVEDCIYDGSLYCKECGEHGD